jgi:hypothetical protein
VKTKKCGNLRQPDVCSINFQPSTIQDIDFNMLLTKNKRLPLKLSVGNSFENVRDETLNFQSGEFRFAFFPVNK